MFDLNKRSYFTTLGELRMLLAHLPADTKVCTGGVLGSYLHFAEDGSLVSFDDDDLWSDYYEACPSDDDDFWQGQDALMMEEHTQRLREIEEGREFFFIGDKLMRIYKTEDDSVDEEDGECFGACWDYELYDVQLKVVDGGQIGKYGNMTREDVIQDVLAWNNLDAEQRTYIPATEALYDLTDTRIEQDNYFKKCC